MGAVGTEFLRNVSATERFLMGISILSVNFFKPSLTAFSQTACRICLLHHPYLPFIYYYWPAHPISTQKDKRYPFSFTWTRTANIQSAHIHLMAASLLIFQSFLEMGCGSFLCKTEAIIMQFQRSCLNSIWNDTISRQFVMARNGSVIPLKLWNFLKALHSSSCALQATIMHISA